MEEHVIVEQNPKEQTKNLQRVERPPLYRVLLLNDDYTPMDFVVLVLRRFFNHSEEAAVQTMLKVHHEHKAVCGIYTRDIALTKITLLRRYAREYQHPLSCVMEEHQ